MATPTVELDAPSKAQADREAEPPEALAPITTAPPTVRVEAPVVQAPAAPTTVDSAGGLTAAELASVLEALGPDWVTEIPDNAEATGPTVGNLPHGEWKLHYSHKGQTDTGQYLLGARSGEWIVRDARGNELQKRTYVAGKIQGSYQFRDSAADQWMTLEYVDGEPATK
ncbi:hypothetical protein [Saltatorellus ferox]|uniref:hypothetical protein n=1 Tax=Saltatorellus ferox TaxID=2528018 RepID=UPI003AF39E11